LKKNNLGKFHEIPYLARTYPVNPATDAQDGGSGAVRIIWCANIGFLKYLFSMFGPLHTIFEDHLIKNVI
jgi:hypothetical protein